MGTYRNEWGPIKVTYGLCLIPQHRQANGDLEICMGTYRNEWRPIKRCIDSVLYRSTGKLMETARESFAQLQHSATHAQHRSTKAHGSPPLPLAESPTPHVNVSQSPHMNESPTQHSLDLSGDRPQRERHIHRDIHIRAHQDSLAIVPHPVVTVAECGRNRDADS